MRMVDVEIVDFNVPNVKSSLLVLLDIQTDLEHEHLYQKLYQVFSQFGLIFKVNIITDTTTDGKITVYIRYYSSRACSRARSSFQRGRIKLTGWCGQSVRLGTSRARPGIVPLLRNKCEELANYYLGFNGWRSRIMYHKQEESDPLHIKFVTVVRLEFPEYGLCCEGAGMVQECIGPDDDSGLNVSVAKRSIGEAFLAAWNKVLLVIVNDDKVRVEINTTKKDAFYYNPLWDEPEVEVNQVDYQQPQDEDQAETGQAS